MTTAILLSGGMDSTTLLWQLKAQNQHPIHAISIDYNQRHRIELTCATHIARDLAAHYDLRKDAWHHTSVVISGASLVEVYTDGTLAWKTRVKGRSFTPEDKLHDLTIGSRWGIAVSFDEVMIHRRALSANEIRDYVTAIRQMADVDYPQ